MKTSFADQLINSVSIPHAPINKACALVTERMKVKVSLEAKFFGSQLFSYEQKLLIAVLFSSGCRVSEALAMLSSDFTPSGLFIIRGLKGSKSATYQLVSFQGFAFRPINRGVYLFRDLNRFHVYRLVRQLGLYATFGDNLLASVTHYFRHLIAMEQQECGFADFFISQTLRHKNLNNVKFYTATKAAER